MHFCVHSIIVCTILHIYVTVRVDVGYSIGVLSRAMNCPTPELLEEAKRVLKYLYTYRHLGLRYTRGGSKKVEGMSDSDWGTKASISAYIFMLCNAVVSYLSILLYFYT